MINEVGAAMDWPSSKRDRLACLDRSNWFPYYASFSSTFARRVLGDLDFDRNSGVILDPWNGSGTTTFVASSMGIKSIGIDRSPVASIAARARLLDEEDGDALSRLADSLEAGTDAHFVPRLKNDPLARWLPVNSVDIVRRIQAHGMSVAHSSPAISAFLQLALFQTLRGIHRFVNVCKNPTWQKPALDREITPGMVKVGLLTTLQQLQVSANELPLPKNRATILTGDSRHLPIRTGSVRVVLSSPPYCNRLDYPISQALEHAILGIDPHDSLGKQLRREFMGSPLVREKGQSSIRREWPESLSKLLKEIQDSEPGAPSTHLKVYRQYFKDYWRSLREIARCLTPSGDLILVVQPCFHKNILIDLPALTVDLASSTGFEFVKSSSSPAAKVLSRCNPFAKKYQVNRYYSETCLFLRRRSGRFRANSSTHRR